MPSPPSIEIDSVAVFASSAKDYAAQLTLRSLRRTVNQLKEEIARFEARDQTATTKK